jgi:signal transduction histidine kinase
MKITSRRLNDIPLRTPEEWRFKIRLIQLLILCALPISTYTLIENLISGRGFAAIFGGAFIALFILALIMVHKIRGAYRPFQFAMFSRIFFVVFLIVNFYDISLGHRLGNMPQAIMYPFLSILILGRREGIAWAVVYYFLIIGGALFQVATAQVVINPITMIITVISISVLVALDTFFLESVRQRSFQQLLDNQRNLAESNKELIRASHEAQAANLSKSEFLANMSHELRTPLNHIIGFTELVHDEKAGQIGESQKEYLGDVLESSRHLLALINDILDMSKIEAGKLELSLSVVDVNAPIDQALMVVQEKAKRHGIALSVSIGDDVDKISCDHRKLRQILYNLLSNAVKFTPDGGKVTVGVDRVNDDVQFSVADTGIGVEAENQEKIFRPFDQIDSSSSREYEGTGLGLSLTKTLVELHNGHIWLESEGDDKGSCFYFSIPLHPAIDNGKSSPENRVRPERSG